MNQRQYQRRPSPLYVVYHRLAVASLLSFLSLAAWSEGTGRPPVAAADSRAGEAVTRLGIAPSYAGELPSLALLNVRNATLQQVVPPLEYPWSFEFINDDEILLTQISGKLLRISLSTGEQVTIGGLPEVGKGYTQIGLLDIEVHPDFSENRRVYLSYSKPHPESSSYHRTEIVTGVISDDRIGDLVSLLDSEEYGWAPSNFGGVLEFDDSGHLYISMGDRGEDVLAQRKDRLEGKVLRLNADGSVPADNPFVQDQDYDPRIYAMGVRNPQGLFFDAPSGVLFEAEHGPLGGDEINLVQAGANYGWPMIGYGNNYATTLPMGSGTHQASMRQPIFYFLPSIATSAITVYHGDMFKEWEGDILVGALRGEHIAKLDFDDGRVRSSHPILSEVGGRIRDIKVANDGSVFILSQTTGLHRLYRNDIATVSADEPDAKSEPPTTARSTAKSMSIDPTRSHPGKEVYELVCAGCHDAGVSGAPVLGDPVQWQTIREQPLALTQEHVLHGYKAMPERGLCYTCKDQQLLDVIDYMLVTAGRDEL